MIRRHWAFYQRQVALASASLLLETGCGGLCVSDFDPGTFVGELPCTLRIKDSSGTESREDFFSSIELVVAEDGRISINGSELTVGREAIRSTPTADLAFVITKIIRWGNKITVTYEPRATLSGISVEGLLIEAYRGHGERFEATADADLNVTDVSGLFTFRVQCAGDLTLR